MLAHQVQLLRRVPALEAGIIHQLAVGAVPQMAQDFEIDTGGQIAHTAVAEGKLNASSMKATESTDLQGFVHLLGGF